jgi:hypothetical protein
MSIVTAELKSYAAASRPEDDASLTGGAIDLATRFLASQFSAAAIVEVVSDGADVRTITVTGRLATGVVDTEALVLNGAVAVQGAKSFERILKAVASAGSGARTVTLKQGAGGTVRGTLGLNETELTILFKKAASSTSAGKTLYEKLFSKNTNGALTLTSAAVTLTADPSAVIKVGCAPAVDDNATVANRTAAPAAVVFVDDSVAQSVPGAALAAGSAIGIWAQLTLAQNNAPIKDTFTVQLAGQTT